MTQLENKEYPVEFIEWYTGDCKETIANAYETFLKLKNNNLLEDNDFNGNLHC